MEKTLELVFKNVAGTSKTISITNPREDVTSEEARGVMETIIEKDVFETAGGSLAEAHEARYRTVDIEALQ